MGTNEVLETVKTRVFNCARCGEDHDDLIFVKMVGKPIMVEDFEYAWWALCPVTRDPLIMRTGGDDDDGQ